MASCVSVSRSRRAMPRNFRRHQLVLVLGRWLWSGQECQKQPSTNTATRAPRAARNRMSTRRRRFPPGTGRSTTNRKPRRCKARRNAISGRVPDLLVRRITREVAGTMPVGPGRGRDAGTRHQRLGTHRHPGSSPPRVSGHVHDLQPRTSPLWVSSRAVVLVVRLVRRRTGVIAAWSAGAGRAGRRTRPTRSRRSLRPASPRYSVPARCAAGT